MPTPTKYGGVISPDNLERKRLAKVSDDSIADEMAQSSPAFAEQLRKVRQKFAGDPGATTALLNTRFYGDAQYSPEPEKPKGFVGRTLDRINDRLIGIGESFEARDRGEQGNFDTAAQTATNLFRVGLAPAVEASSTVIGGALKATGADKAIGAGVRTAIDSDLYRDYAAPAVEGYKAEKQKNPALRTFEGAAMAGLETLDVVGTAAAYRKLGGEALEKGIANVAMHPIRSAQAVPGAIGKGIGTAARVATSPLKSFRQGLRQGYSGADDAAEAAVKADPTDLAGKAKEAVDKGVDERLVRFITERNPDERHLMKAMVREAENGTTKLGGTTKAKEIAGQQILRNAEYVVEQKENVGKALGNIADVMAGETLDLTDDGMRVLDMMSDRGVVFDRAGKIVSVAGAADDEIAVLQKIADFFQPDDYGRIVRSFGESHQYRRKLFAELDMAKARLAPTSAGQSAFSVSDSIGQQARSGILRKMSELNPNYGNYSRAYAELTGDAADFFKAIGYKGNLDDLGTQALRTGEVSMRALGNASARPTEALQKLFGLSRKYGYSSQVDEMSLLRFADELENVFPIAPTRSLRGEVGKGVTDAFAKNTIQQKGAIMGALKTADEKLYDVYQWARGMTPENRLKLLYELLDEPDQSLVSAAKSALPDGMVSGLPDAKGKDAARAIARSLDDGASQGAPGSPRDQAGPGTAPGAAGTGSPAGGGQGGSPYDGTLPQSSKNVNGSIFKNRPGFTVIPGMDDAPLSSGNAGEPGLAHISLDDLKALEAAEKAYIAKGMDPVEALAKARSDFLSK